MTSNFSGCFFLRVGKICPLFGKSSHFVVSENGAFFCGKGGFFGQRQKRPTFTRYGVILGGENTPCAFFFGCRQI